MQRKDWFCRASRVGSRPRCHTPVTRLAIMEFFGPVRCGPASCQSALPVFVRALRWPFPPRTRTPDMSNKNIDDIPLAEQVATVSRRGFLKLAGASGLATAAGSLASTGRAAAPTPDGTPEQLHRTRGNEPPAEIA